MSSPLSLKRKRISESTTRLTKPFVSPLRTAKSETQAQTTADNKENGYVYLPSTIAHTVQGPHAQDIKPQEPAKRPLSFTPARSTPVRKQQVYSTTSKHKDPAERSAERALTALELQIRAVKNDIDALTQAAKLRSSTSDTDLEALTQKWRLASQTAAEELFGTVKERVNRMGGVQAWRESEKRKYDRSHGLGEFAEAEAGGEEEDDDADCEFDSQGEELPEEEQEYRRRMKRQARKEMIEAADVDEGDVGYAGEGEGKGKAVWMEPGGEDDAFTMDMMLRSLNIELKLIGYDKDAQRWVS